MDTVVKIVRYLSANTMKHQQFRGLLKGVGDHEFKKLFVANAHWLSHGRVLLRFTALLTPRFSFFFFFNAKIFLKQKRMLTKYSAIKDFKCQCKFSHQYHTTYDQGTSEAPKKGKVHL